MNDAAAPIAEASLRVPRRPLWLGALAAACAPAVALAVASAADAFLRGDFIGLHGWPAMLATFALTLAVSSAAMLAGLPLLWWLRARGRLSGVRVCTTALLVAGFALLAGALAGSPLSVLGDLVALACGALAGAVFCLVAGVPWRINRATAHRPSSSHAAQG